MTQREIQSDPNIPDPNSPDRGPGLRRPGRQEGALPAPRHVHAAGGPVPDRAHQPRQHRQPRARPHPRHRRRHHAAQPVQRPTPRSSRPARTCSPPESYGFVSGLLPTAQSRGIGTLPGGIPIYQERQQARRRHRRLLPGHDRLRHRGELGPQRRRLLRPDEARPVAGGRVHRLRRRRRAARWRASRSTRPRSNAQLGLPSFPIGETFDLPFGRIDLVGITLDIFGATAAAGPAEPRRLRPDARPGRPATAA